MRVAAGLLAGCLHLVLAAGGSAAAPIIEDDILLLVTDQGSNTVWAVDPASGARSVVSSGGLLNKPIGITADTSTGEIFVTNIGGGLDNREVLRIDAATGAQSIVASGLAGPSGIALESADHLLVSDVNIDRILRIDRVSGQSEIVTFGGLLSDPRHIDVDSTGLIWVAESHLGRVVTVDPLDGTQTLVLDRGTSVWAVAVAPGDDIVLSDRGSPPNEIFRIDPVTLQADTLAMTGSASTGLGVSGSGRVFFSNLDESVFELNPMTGEIRLITDALVHSDDISAVPRGFVPLPEPSTAFMLLVGLVGSLWSARREELTARSHCGSA